MDYEVLTAGIGQVTVGEGLIHMTLLKASVLEDGGGEVVHELVMPPGGFLQLFDHIDQVVTSLEKQGAFRRGEADG
jgi:hypothetical protein